MSFSHIPGTKEQAGWEEVKDAPAPSLPPICGEHTLPNGRTYRIRDTGKPYMGGEYPSGGLLILAWSAATPEKEARWLYIDNSPDEECARAFLEGAVRLAPLSPAQCGLVSP